MPESQTEKQQLISTVLELLRPIFETHNEPVYLVGGAVRDILLNKSFYDLDFAVPRNAIELAFKAADSLGYPAYVLDRDRDAGRVVIPDSAITLDFASFRQSSLEEDLYKRDFTINAMALPASRIEKENLIDPYGGAADLIKKVIKITNPDAISDDPVRVLRAVRFATDLNFELSRSTINAIERSCQDIVRVSGERVRDELLQILASQSPQRGLRMLSDLWILDYILPEIADLIGVRQGQPESHDMFEQTMSRFIYLTGMNTWLSNRTKEKHLALDSVEESFSQIAPDLKLYFDRKVDGGIDGWTILLLGALFFDIGWSNEPGDESAQPMAVWVNEQLPADIAAHRMKALRMSREAIKQIRTINSHRNHFLKLATRDEINSREVYHYFRSTGHAGIDIAWLVIADQLAIENDNFRVAPESKLLLVARLLLENYFLRYETAIRPSPLVNGSDLMDELNIIPGPALGQLLAIIEEAQAVGEVSTPDEAINLAQEHLARN